MSLSLGCYAYQSLGGRVRDVRRLSTIAVLVGQYMHAAVTVHAHTAVRSAEIDTDSCTAHTLR